ncbi:trans-sulfuration enzyme family protein [Niallia sp. 03133]|uniref:trans-sulfuration enzyme family protein n=1 Tax=Niallia sp. 03133 TaxID=3458060 RepID=UPI00404415F6
MDEKMFSRETEILNKGAYLKGRADSPEAAPLYLTTAFNVEDLDDLEDMYSVQGYTYIRTRNPNRNALAELVTYLEKGENSLIFSCGMAAISTALLSILEQGDHVLSDKTLYGETIDLLEGLSKFGISVTFIDFTNLEEVHNSIQPNTKVLYTETISNPMITIVDIEALAAIAHENKAKLVVDNTFTTSLVIRPIEKGADITINSLTKFANGHSDVSVGSITASEEIIKKAYSLQVLLGTTANPFDAWMCQRGMRTMDLRVQKQMDNAAKLAKALEKHPNVLKVHHPSLDGHPQNELAQKIFENGYGGMLSFEMPNNREKINEFMRRLKIAHYAMTLGGYRTTISHPVSSSHYAVPEEERLKMGITFGLLRVSVGIESPDDLIADFSQALDVFNEEISYIK